MTQHSPYQILPDLLPEEYEALKASIAERGVDIPIIVDEVGKTVDGFHREKACDELGIFCPREVREFASEADKFELVLRANCRRRQLTGPQKRTLIAAYLKKDARICPNALANLIGVSKNTVADVREELIATRQIDKFDTLRGRDGKQRPTKYKRIIANTPKEAETAMKIIGDLPANCGGKTLDVITAKRRARRHQSQKEIDRETAELWDDQNIRLCHCRFQDLEIELSSVRLILTDIPYNKVFVPQVSDLARLAARWLGDGGLLAMYSGIICLNEVVRRLDEHLQYGWMGASAWTGKGNLIQERQVVNNWKPVVVYSKGPWRKLRRWCDTSIVNTQEKDWHSWQQPLEDVEHWERQFSKPGDLVVDPCGGGFTTAVACYRLGRRFIGCDCDEECVLRGRQRLVEEQAKRESLLNELMVWIEDTEEFKVRRPGTNYQPQVWQMWTMFSGGNEMHFKTYLHLLPESHRAIWESLAQPA